jgi:hypothetical protein
MVDCSKLTVEVKSSAWYDRPAKVVQQVQRKTGLSRWPGEMSRGDEGGEKGGICRRGKGEKQNIQMDKDQCQ